MPQPILFSLIDKVIYDYNLIQDGDKILIDKNMTFVRGNDKLSLLLDSSKITLKYLLDEKRQKFDVFNFYHNYQK